MRWNCPHCGTNLAVSDEKMSSGWSFSRCYKCAGFALVRRSDVNLIKVDRAPAGETVLLPEANENPTTMLSQAATDHLARYVGAKAERAKAESIQASAAAVLRSADASGPRPTIRPATRRNAASATTSPTASAIPAAAPILPARSALPTAIPPARAAGSGFGLPDPLPEEPSTSWTQRLIPAAIAMTGAFAIASGIYLYVQGQALWEKARSQAADAGSETPPGEKHARAVASEVIPASPLIDEVRSQAMAPDRTATDK